MRKAAFDKKAAFFLEAYVTWVIKAWALASLPFLLQYGKPSLMRTLLHTFLAWSIGLALSAQAPFSVYLEPVNIQGLGGLQSYAFAQHSGHWVFIGGRLDGLHRRQPWASFDLAGHNNQIWVVDPNNGQVWSASIQSLSAAMQDQLSATNLEFYQEGDYLYLVGGYGYSQVISDHRTHPYLAAIHLPGIIQAVKTGGALDVHIRQINDSYFAVTGGYLLKMYNKYYIVGGQRFDGRYNPMGHGTFTQVYTEAIKRFEIVDDGQNLAVNKLADWVDPALLHRRDYNVLPQILPNGEEAMVAFAGVFQTTVDLPFLNIVQIDSNGYAEVPGFQQFYQQYHCAHLPLYEASTQQMHNLFFGGMSQFYDSAGVRIEDQNVPFVRTIASVSFDAQGVPTEWLLPTQMPDLLGGSAEFIPLPNLPTFSNEVVKMDDLVGDTVLLGHIFGGILSSAPNIFWINDGTQSTATSELFKVYLLRNASIGQEEVPSNVHPLKAWFDEEQHLRLQLPQRPAERFTAWVADLQGRELFRQQVEVESLVAGQTVIDLGRVAADSLPPVVLVGVEIDGHRQLLKVLSR